MSKELSDMSKKLIKKIKEHKHGEAILKYQEYIDEMFGSARLYDSRDIYDFLKTYKK